MNGIPIDGSCDPKFEAVEDAFRRNMENGDPDCGEELGACVSVVIDGEPVVDLWGGYRDAARTKAWERDTVTCMMSVTKSCAAIALLTLIDRGAVSMDDRVSDHWPEFTGDGKDEMSVRTLISHQSGVIYADAAPAGSLWDGVSVERALEAAKPEWEPGTGGAYHSFTYGPLMSALIRRADGRDVGTVWREDVADPFGIDFHIGLNDEEASRRAEFVETPGTPSRDGIKGEAESPLTRGWNPLPKSEDFNSDEWVHNQFASANGHGNARAIARLYGGLSNGGMIDGKRLLSEELIADAIREHWDDLDRMTNRPFRFACGFMLSCPPFPFGGHRDNFGHTGIGGAVGFGDPVRHIGFSYCGNRMAPIADMGPFATPLVDAMYEAL
ncbi:MAG: beta-lactamase family protein [Alphaproteobacteria bacterium]|nr:beta-lactamase family protein [Alphaproteobacteria bacterium]